jgi:ssDNA-specific exonuclease RecJ
VSRQRKRGRMTKHELIKLLDNTFYDVEFDVFDDTEGLVRVNFVIDKEEKDES